MARRNLASVRVAQIPYSAAASDCLPDDKRFPPSSKEFVKRGDPPT
jgi:hypothetical protein